MSDPKHPNVESTAKTVDDARDGGARTSHTDSWRVREALSTQYDEEEGDADGLVGTTVAGRFLVKRLLGQGGMGAVYAAEHTQLKKLVALKILHGTMSTNEEVVARFEREAVAAGKLVHPGIATASDFGRLEDGSFYLALEFIDGRSLLELLEEEKRLPAERATGIAIQITDALAAAHAAGIVHRDMKPENVMLVRTEDGEDYVKVVDFGIAKVRSDGDAAEGLTRAGLVFGTPEYMSPEQALGHEADERSDLYGVGMVLYEMLSGRSPFRADDVTEMLAAQIKQPPPRLPEDVPEALAELVSNLLEKDPENRPEDAYGLLERFLEIGRALGWFFPPPRTTSGARPERGRIPSVRPPAVETRRGSTPSAESRASKNRGKKSKLRFLPFAALAVGTAIGAVAMLSNEEVVQSEETRQEAELVDAEAQLVQDASGGDREAISALRKLTILEQKELEAAGLLPPEKAASASERPSARSAGGAEKLAEQANRFMVLGRGYSAIKHHSAAVEMYREAVRLDPYLSQDTELLMDVRVAIAARDAVDDGLDFALHQLGSHGADLIYDVYLDHLGEAGMTPVVARAMRVAKSDDLMAQATPELQVALRLQKAKYCAEYRDIIPDAAKYADDRSLQKLEALESTRGCGPGAKNDCFVCLRKPDVPLAEAVARARAHPSPSFVSKADVAATSASD